MKFKCQTSCGGQCCSLGWRGSSFVFLTQSDRERLSAYLKSPVTEFADLGEFEFTRFTFMKTRQWFMKTTNGVCKYFDNGKCGVYEARPVQCRTFPFWPELMSPQSWNALKPVCPGIGKGNGVHFEDQRAMTAEQVAADEELKRQVVA